MTELQKLQKDTPHFMANGKKYLVEHGISIERYALLQQFTVELGAGMPITQVFERCKEAYEKANALKMADAAVIMHNIISGIADWVKREDPVLHIAALFINEENEDRRTITDERIKTKIDDWKVAGIDYSFFLPLVQNILLPLIKAWTDILRNTQAEKQKGTAPV